MSNASLHRDQLTWSVLGDTLKSFHDQFVEAHEGDPKLIKETTEQVASIITGSPAVTGVAKLLRSELLVMSGETQKRPFFDAKFAALADYACFAVGANRSVSINLDPITGDSLNGSEAVLAAAHDARIAIFSTVHQTFFASEGALLADIDTLTDDQKRTKAQQIGRKSWRHAEAMVEVHRTIALNQPNAPGVELSQGLPKVGGAKNDRFNILNRMVLLAAAAPASRHLEIAFPVKQADDESTGAN